MTVGGAIAADIHGKNHHVSGSFGDHVRSLELVTADGTTRSSGRSRAGAVLGDRRGDGPDRDHRVRGRRLRPVESAWMSVDTERLADLADLMARMRAADRDLYLLGRLDRHWLAGGRWAARS